MKSIFLRTALAAGALLGGALRAAPGEGAVVIANESVPVASLSAAALKDVYTGRTMYWADGQIVVIAVLADNSGTALKEASGMDASQFKTFWQRMVFSGRGQLPRKVDEAAALVALVATTKGAIALVPADAVLKGVKIIEIK